MKQTLRDWRNRFAPELRRLGVPANATPRSVQAETMRRLKDPIYRASLRGQSTQVGIRLCEAEPIWKELRSGVDIYKSRGIKAREELLDEWRAIGSLLETEGHGGLAAETRRFTEALPQGRSTRPLLSPTRPAEYAQPSPFTR
jgi:hypothetical protein